MTGEDVGRCPTGTKLIYCFGEGPSEKRYPAEARHNGQGCKMIVVWFAEDDRRSFRWSIRTNKPISESRGYVGKVRLERAP